MNDKKIIDVELKYDCNFGNKHHLALVKGKNSKVWDSKDNIYIDCVSGMGVMNVGHANPEIIDAVKNQVAKLSICHQSYPNNKRAEYLNSLASILPKGLSKIYLCNSGTEATEAMLKVTLAATKRTKIVACKGGYHGLTLGATGLASLPSLREPFKSIIHEATFIEFNNIEELHGAVDNNTAAVVFELVQGSSGGEAATKEFVQAARELTDKFGSCLIFDEVLTGFCRTGKWFATNHYDSFPDGIILAKAIGGGLPIGAFAMTKELADNFPKGIHSNTFGGNPLSMAAGLAAIEYAKRTNLCEQTEKKSDFFDCLSKNLIGRSLKSIKGMGLLKSLALRGDSQEYMLLLREKFNILTIPRNESLLLLPPLTIPYKDIEVIVRALSNTFCKFDS
ncbi:aspartate aminotransferase family protein [Microbulbifer sp. GL-2]|uniref:aspartate aminotransferase family protein n=1 Tax=Microbulbifer sp. GL-2 TaxID=2591606 RepID=UPI001161CAB4|nr:aminotransferase class III-fold pyridoxal phosphate-dependent enzyme [Microbulbifer sp. GL-2]BBM03629.1 acetylornithine/acetyl-lysine aminotransferase [Microbulbifer sp. GL-2]